MVAGLTDGWWEFDGTGDALRLLGTDSDANIFDPALNTNNFSIVGQFSPDAIAGTPFPGVLFSKMKRNGGFNYSWQVYTSDALIGAGVSDDGTNGTWISIAGVLTTGINFFAVTYSYIAPGLNNLLKLFCNGSSTSSAIARGPVHIDTDADVQISDFDYTADRFFKGKQYWLGYWNSLLSDATITALAAGTVLPKDLSPDYYEDFHEDVPQLFGYLPSEIPATPTIDFTIEGNPIHGGSTESTIPPVPVTNSWKSEILIDNTVVWDTSTSKSQQSVSIDVTEYVGEHDLKFRLKKMGDPPAPSIELSDGLFAYYAFENAAALGEDSSGNNNLPNVFQATQDVGGKINSCVKFNGAGNQYIRDTTPGTDFDCANLSISTWVYTDDLNRWQGIITKRRLDPEFQWSIATNQLTNKWGFGIRAGGALSTVQSTSDVINTGWVHLVGTYDGTYIRIYINGVLENTVLHAGGGAIDVDPTISVNIGSRDDAAGTSDWFDGLIDESGLWDRALTNTEVGILYNGGIGLSYAQIIAL